jgi:hypothetical protein
MISKKKSQEEAVVSPEEIKLEIKLDEKRGQAQKHVVTNGGG